MANEYLDLLRQFADGSGVSNTDLRHLQNAGLIYSDGVEVRLTESGRNALLESRPTWLEDSDHSQCPDDDSYLPPPNLRAQHRSVTETAQAVLNTIARGAIDMVNQPPHYTAGGIECIDAIRAALTPEEFRGFCKGNAIKYSWREKLKGGDEDLKKAAWYLAKVAG